VLTLTKHLLPDGNFGALPFLGALGASVIVAALLNRLIERPAMSRLRSALMTRSSPQASAGNPAT
jgi:peptidoglycan/LPS O-acetylase OafA/YrhL